MKTKTKPLNYDISFHASVNFLSFDLRCNLILRLYIYIHNLKIKIRVCVYIYIRSNFSGNGWSHFGYSFYQTFHALPRIKF
jgi:hypothetical protein